MGCYYQALTSYPYVFRFVPKRGTRKQKAANYCVLRIERGLGDVKNTKIGELSESDDGFAPGHDCMAKFRTKSRKLI